MEPFSRKRLTSMDTIANCPRLVTGKSRKLQIFNPSGKQSETHQGSEQLGEQIFGTSRRPIVPNVFGEGLRWSLRPPGCCSGPSQTPDCSSANDFVKFCAPPTPHQKKIMALLPSSPRCESLEGAAVFLLLNQSASWEILIRPQGRCSVSSVWRTRKQLEIPLFFSSRVIRNSCCSANWPKL